MADSLPNDPKNKGAQDKAPQNPAEIHDPDEVVELGQMPDLDLGGGETSSSQQSGPLSGASVVTWDQLMRAKSEADIHLDFDAIQEVEIDSESDRDLLKSFGLDEPKSSLHHSAPAEEFAEVGKGTGKPGATPSEDYSESSIFASSGKSKRGDESEVDLLGQMSMIESSVSTPQQKTDEIIPPKLHGQDDVDVTDELGAEFLRDGEASAVDLGSAAVVDLPFPIEGEVQSKGGSSRARKSDRGHRDDSGAVDLVGKGSGNMSTIPGLTGAAGSHRSHASNLPSTRRLETGGGSKGGWLGGGLIGTLAGVGICVAAYFAGVVPQRDGAKTATPPMAQAPPATPATPVPAADFSSAVVLLDQGDLDKAVEQLDKLDKSNGEARVALGQARFLRYLRDCKVKSAKPDISADELKAAQADLKAQETATTALWLGLIEESFGRIDDARKIYQDATRKYGNDAKLFQAALDRLESRPSGPAVPRLTINSFAASVFTLLIQAESNVPDEAGFEYWKAVRLAKQHKYSEAQTALKAARDAHDARRVLLARKGLNPTSDPLEEVFLRCCDELRDYWSMRNQLHTGGYDLTQQTSSAAALTQALNRGRTDSEELKTTNNRLAAVKDALSQTGYDLNDLPSAVNKLVKAKEKLDTTVKTAQSEKTEAESRQQAAIAQVSQLEAAKKLVDDELKKTKDQMAAMKPTTGAEADVAKLREEKKSLETRAKELEGQLTTARQSADRSQATARDLMGFVTSVKQKIQSPPDAKPGDVLTNLDRALAAKPAPRADLPATPTAAASSDPTAERAFSRGLSSYRSGDLAAAQKEFSTAVNSNGMDARYWYFLGLSKQAQGQDATDEFRQGAERERRNLPNSRVIDASLERLSPEGRAAINRVRGR